MKVIIAGSRTLNDYQLVVDAIKEAGFDITEIVSGHARGIDTQGELFAIYNKIPFERFLPDWETNGRSAGFIRNAEMANYADAAIVIHNGSNGAMHMIRTMKKKNKPVFEKIV